MIIGGRSCSQRVSKTRKNPPARQRGRESRRVALDETHLDGKRNREGTLTSAMSRQCLIDLLTDSAGPFVNRDIYSLSLSYSSPSRSTFLYSTEDIPACRFIISSVAECGDFMLPFHRSWFTLHSRGAINDARDAFPLASPTVFRNRRVTRFHLAEDRS
jgi:hypothetical protein